MPARFPRVKKKTVSESSSSNLEQPSRPVIDVNNKKPVVLNGYVAQKHLKKKILLRRKVDPKYVINGLKGNAEISNKVPISRVKKIIVFNPERLKYIPGSSDASSNSSTTNFQEETGPDFTKLMEATSFVVDRLSRNLDEVKAKALVNKDTTVNSHKKPDCGKENPILKIHDYFTEMEETVRNLRSHVICNSQRTIQDIPLVAEINYLQAANSELRKDVNDLKLRLYELKLQRKFQQEDDTDEDDNDTKVLDVSEIPQQTIVYITS